MTNPPVEKRARKAKERKFYVTSFDYNIGRVGWRLENLEVLAPGHVLMAPIGQRGIPDYPESPRLLIDKSLGRAPRDWEMYHDFFLVSDRMKTILSEIDPDGVVFTRCETRLRDRSEGPIYWLCDVARILDAVDEEKSQVKIKVDPRYQSRTYNLLGGTSLVFKEDVVGPAHIFRLRYSQSSIVSDEVLRDACKSAGLKGILFKDASKY